MAMNKKEKEELEHLKTLLAFRLTKKVNFDVFPPTKGYDVFNGYTINIYNREVTTACTNSYCHSRTRHDVPTSRGTICLYSTKLLALKALRHELEIQYSKHLKDIDTKIEQEEVK